MTQISVKVEDLLAKHPTLSQEEAIKIVTDKNERKNKKRAEKAARSNANKDRNQSIAPDVDEA